MELTKLEDQNRVPNSASAPGTELVAPRVLVIEDSGEMRRLLCRVLTRSGFQCLEAGDGIEGIAMARAECPDVILMDLALPKLNGLEATRMIRQDSGISHIPVLAVTAHARPADEKMAREAGCDDYISKPYTLAELTRRVWASVRPMPVRPAAT